MDQEGLYKLFGLVSVIVTSGLAIWNTTLGRRKNFKEDYAFARDFFAELKDEMHPLVRERGFQALAGTASVSASEIECLLALDSTGSSIGAYLLGRHYLAHVKMTDSNRFQFKTKYRTKAARISRKFAYFLMYLFFSFAALNPFFLPLFSDKIQTKNLLFDTAGWLITFGPFAFFAMREAVKISSAEGVVARQRLQTPSWNSSRVRTVRDELV